MDQSSATKMISVKAYESLSAYILNIGMNLLKNKIRQNLNQNSIWNEWKPAMKSTKSDNNLSKKETQMDQKKGSKHFIVLTILREK